MIRTALGLAALALVAMFAATLADMRWSDQLSYANIAQTILHDPATYWAAPTNHPFGMRIGITLPLAAIYGLFGASTFTTSLPCLLAALTILYVVYAAAPTPRAKLLGVVFVACAVPLARFISILSVDLVAAALLGCATLWLSYRERPRGRWWVIAAVVAWFVAVMAKESAVWLAPAWLYAIVVDLRAGGWRRTLRTFAPGLAVGLVLAIAYVYVCARVWGDPLARLHGIQELGGQHSWSIASHGDPAWLHRLTWGPLVLFVTSFGLPVVLATVSPWHVRGRERLWIAATFAILALFWFGSATLSTYDPLPLERRMVLPAMPGVLVLAAITGDRLLERVHGRWRTLAIAAIALLVVGHFASVVTHRLFPATPETDTYAALRSELADPARPITIVCADERCLPLTEFYLGYDVPPHVTIQLAGDFAASPPPEGKIVRVVVNLERSAYVRAQYGEREWALQIEAQHLPVLARHAEVRLYDAGDGRALHAALRR